MEYGLRYVRDAPNLMWDAVLYGICWVNDTMSSNLSKYGSPLSQILSPVSISETLECKLRDVETMRRSCTSADRSDARGSLTPYPPPARRPRSHFRCARGLHKSTCPCAATDAVAGDVTASRTTRNGVTRQSVKLFVLFIRTPMGTMLTTDATVHSFPSLT